MALQIDHLICLRDNFVWLLREPESGAVACVDPSEAAPVKAKLDALGWQLTHILNTHHHPDHTGGNVELKRMTGATIVGPAADKARIPGIDIALAENETYDFGKETARVYDIPGHTRGHIAFWFEKAKAVFTGDTLFAMGCGRLFEGTPAMMWSSLSKLMALPDATRVYCGHEYTLNNGKFALSIEPNNGALKARMKDVEATRAKNAPTMPSTIGLEKATNPFLRPNSAEIRQSLDMEGASDVEVFGEMRKRKDNF